MTMNARDVARRWFESVWNERRGDLIDELMAPEAQGHVEGGIEQGREDFRRTYDAFLSAFPDLRMVIEDVVGEEDRASVRWRAEGTHAGDALGFPATNRPVRARGTTWLTVRDGRIVEGWDTWNMNAFMESLR